MAYWSSGPVRMNSVGRSWVPDAQQRKYFEDAKRDLECFFISYKEGVNAHKLYGKIAQDSDVEINFKRMGFNTFGEFLYQCRDILRLKSDGFKHYLFLRGGATSDTEHVRQLVQRQSARTKFKGFVAKQNNTYDVPIDTLLNLHYDLSIPPEQQPAPSRSRSGGARLSIPRFRSLGRPSRSRHSHSRTSSLGAISTVPVLKPLNAAAVALNMSLVPNLQPMNPAAKNLVPILKPLNAAAVALNKPLVPNLKPLNPAAKNLSLVPNLKPLNAAAVALNSVPKLRPINPPPASKPPPLRPLMEAQSQNSSVSRASVPVATVLRNSKPHLNTALPKVNKVPALVPFHVIQQRLMNISAPTTQTETSITSNSTNSTTLSSRITGNRGDSIQMKQNLSTPAPMSSLRREVTPKPTRAMASDEDDEEKNRLEYLNKYAPPRRNSLEDVSMDEIDGTVIKKNNQKNESQQSTAQHVVENSTRSSQVQSEDLSLKFEQLKISTGGKIIYSVERQMKLPEKNFQANLLGADPHGYIYIQVAESKLQDAFKQFLEKLNNFYDNEENQNEFRMRVDELKVGNLVVVNVEGKSRSYCRGRIDEIVSDVGYCFVFDIDECVYNTVKFDDIYHIDSPFTCARRLPMAVMCLQRGTEQVALTSKFEELFANVLPHFMDQVTVSNVAKVDPLFKVPIVTITCNGKDLGALICKGLPEVHPDSITSLTAEQKQTLTSLEKRCHITPTKP